MAIPERPDLNDFLSGIKLSSGKPPFPNGGIQIPFMPTKDQSGNMKLWLHHPVDTKVTFKGILKCVKRELIAAQHARRDEFALFVLAIATLMPAAQDSPISKINKIINQVCDADVTLYYALFAELPQVHNFEFPPFRIGPLRTEELRQRCEKANSAFYSGNRDRLRGAWAIERELQKVRVLDVESIRQSIFDEPLVAGTRERWEHEAWESIVDGYFSLHNRVLFDEFWTELVSVQSTLLALGAPFFDPRPLSRFVQHMSIAVFDNLGRDRRSFVAPAGTGHLPINLANVHDHVPKLREELKRSYDFERFDETPLHRSIKLYTDFIGRARRHEIDGRISEAFLHFVIALELIFGDRQAIQKSVARRVAFITFGENRRSFHEQSGWIDNIYELRSRYVHNGVEIGDEARLDELRIVCKQVFECLMRFQARPPEGVARGENALKAWLLNLDYLAAGMLAGKMPTEEQLSEVCVRQQAPGSFGATIQYIEAPTRSQPRPRLVSPPDPQQGNSPNIDQPIAILN